MNARPQLSVLDGVVETDAADTTAVLRQRLDELDDERVAGAPMSPRERARYAHGLVSASGVQEGESLTVAVADDADADLAFEVAVNAYRRGARLVRLVAADTLEPRLANRLRARGSQTGQAIVLASARDALTWEQVLDEDSAYLVINEWPDDASLDQAIDDNLLRWCVAYWPSPSLARAWELTGPDGERHLAERLLEFSRNLPADPLDAYDRHLDRLKRRARALNELELDRVTVRDQAGTDLTIGLLDTSRFQACDWETAAGKRFSCNYPSEEVFTTPDPARVEGRLVTVAPLEIAGLTLQELRAEFQEGRVTWLEARTGDGRDVSAQVFQALAAEEATLRLGELALVGADSRVGAHGELYGINNLDENFGVHVALGDSYLAGLDGMTEDPRRNRSLSFSHIDLTLSRGQADVVGHDRHGRTVTIMRGGAWEAGLGQAGQERAAAPSPQVG